MSTAQVQSNTNGSDEDPLSHWLKLTSQVALPMLPASGRRLRTLVANDNVSLNAITPEISKDPAASLMVVRAANQIAQASSSSNSETKQILTIEHCVGVLGYMRLRTLISEAPLLETAFTQTSYVNYAGSLMRSLHAGYQAQDWAGLRGHHRPEHICLEALLYGAPYWALWQAAPAEMKIIEHLKSNEKIPAIEAELAVLGVTTATLATALAQTWQLPPDVQDAYDPTKAPHLKTFLKAGKQAITGQRGTMPIFDPQGQPTNNSATQVQLANWLAQEADIGWQTPQMLRCISVIASFLNQPLPAISKRLRQQALAVSRAYCLPGIQTPGARLLQPRAPRDRRKLTPDQVIELVRALLAKKTDLAKDSEATAPAEMTIQNLVTQVSTPAPKPQTAPKTAPTATAPKAQQTQEEADSAAGLANAKLFKKLLKRLRYQPETFAEQTSILQLTAHGMLAGIGLKRIIILRPTEEGSHLEVSESMGTDIDAMENLTLALDPPNLFTKLLKSPASLRVDNLTNGNVLSLVPNSFKTATNNCGNFFTTCLFAGRTPVAVVYADNGNADEELPAFLYNYFKAICKLSSSCLKHLHTRQNS